MMRLRPGDHVAIEFEAEVVAVQMAGAEVTVYELRLAGAPPGETWLVPPEAVSSDTGPSIRPIRSHSLG